MDQKVHEIPLEFKKSYDSSLQGVVLIRAQFINNQEELYRDILSQLQKKESLIIEALNILEKQSMRVFKHDESPENKKFQLSREDSKVLGAGFYSWNESEDLGQDPDETEEAGYYFQHSFDVQQKETKKLVEFSKIETNLNFSKDEGYNLLAL
jgi:hypothetical protein